MIFVPRKDAGDIKVELLGRKKLRLLGHGSQAEIESNSQSLDKITHDIRSSINIIIGYAQLMLDQTTGKINDQQRQALQDILKSTNRLNDLTDVITRRLNAVSDKKL
jgi:signal transduction histidine kinase